MKRTNTGVKSALKQPHLVSLPIKKLCLAPYLVQKPDRESLGALVESIRRCGLLSPIGVRRIKARRYEVLYGARRFAALRILGVKKIPCFVFSCKAPGLFLALSENLLHQETANVTLKTQAARLGTDPAALCRRYALPLPRETETEYKLQGICFFEESEEPAPPQSGPIRKGFFRDARLIANSIERALELGKNAGFGIEAQKIERGREICYHIRLPRSPELSAPPDFPRAG